MLTWYFCLFPFYEYSTNSRCLFKPIDLLKSKNNELID